MTIPTALPASAAAPLPAEPTRLSAGSIFLRILLLVGVALAALATLAVWTFWPRGDTRALRRAVQAELPGHWSQQVEFRLGGPVCDLAQAVTAFVPMPEEARAAVGALKSVELSLARLPQPASRATGAAALAAARRTMLARGWEPTALVNDGHADVAVFTRSAGLFGGRLKVCTFVLDGTQLVIANAELDPAPLADVVRRALGDARSRAR